MIYFAAYMLVFVWIIALFLYLYCTVKNRTNDRTAIWVTVTLFFSCLICAWLSQYDTVMKTVTPSTWWALSLFVLVFPFFVISALVTQDFVENVEYVCKATKELYNNKPKRNLLFRMYDRICYFTKKVYNSIIKHFIWKK